MNQPATPTTLTVTRVLRGGEGLAATILRRCAVVELDWDVRQRSRFACHDTLGRAVAVFLPRGTVLRGGDVLVAQDGTLLRVQAAAQPLLRVTASPHAGPLALLRAAYHLGNRHVALQLCTDYLLLEHDPVLADLLQRLGLIVDAIDAPFDPETGAYGGHSHSHDHDHGHGVSLPEQRP